MMCEVHSKTKSKILIVGPMPPLIGGIATHISDLLKSNLTEEFELIPFTTSRPLNKNKIPVVHNYNIVFNFTILYLMKCIIVTAFHILYFPVVIINVKPDLVHIHTSSYWSFLENSCYVLISKIFRQKIVIHIHGSDFDDFYLNASTFTQKYVQRILNYANYIVALSEYWENFFEDKIKVNNIVIIRNSVNASKYNTKTIKDNSNKNLSVLFIGGQDSKRKGAYDIIKAMPLIINEIENVKFIFIGKGQIEEIKRMCKELNLEDHVQILDFVPEESKISFFNNSDVFVLPSYAEGLPISLLEAMASGLPIVSSNVGGIPEVIIEEINGYLIHPGDYKELASKVLILLKNDQLRNTIGNNNICKINVEHDTKVIVSSISSLYHKVIGR